ncbi:MAG: GldG family protein [Gammaproteobacteria bacterium]|nr:GldG family protein [Gammaproteobacteria bacterium]
MQVSKKSHRQQRLQTWGFVILFLAVIGLLAFLSTRYHIQSDWTASGRHSLSAATTELLQKLEGPITLTSFSRGDDLSGLRKRTRELVGRYQRIKPDIALNYIDPDQHPEQVRELGITLDGELRVEYAGRAENLRSIGEQALTNALQRLMRSGERRVLFISGHGERRHDGQANHDMGEWGRLMQQKGFRLDSLNLSLSAEIPEDTAVLVLASPQVALLPGEVVLIQDYVQRGGNLLWLSEPGGPTGLQPLADELGLEFLPGTLVDPTGQMLGIDNPAFIVVAEYPQHPVSEALTTLTLFPEAQALNLTGREWQSTPLLRSLPRSWSEAGPMEGNIAFDEKEDLSGPLTIGLLLTRRQGKEAQTHEQRIAVIGDGDFLANSYLGNGANQDLGSRLLNWLSHDDSAISIPPRTSPDTRLALTPTLSIVLGFGFLIVLPGVLLGSGLTIWWKRRKR